MFAKIWVGAVLPQTLKDVTLKTWNPHLLMKSQVTNTVYVSQDYLIFTDYRYYFTVSLPDS